MTLKERIIERLEADPGEYLSGERLAETLSVSRAAVWKAVDALRAEGRAIDAAPRRGYRLAPTDDGLSPGAVRRYLRGAARDLRIRTLERVDSTNSCLRKLAEAGEPGGLCVIAAEQTAGRGRRGRSFCSPKGTGLYMSLLLRPELAPERAIRITTAAAVAVCRAAETLCGCEARIKWVNDVLVGGRKVCGILTEASYGMETGRLDYAILGVGVNLAPPEGGFPAEIAGVAGALVPAPRPGLRSRMAAEILNELVPLCADLDAAGFAEEYRARSLAIGRKVRVIAAGETYDAAVLDVDGECRLRVRRADGREETLSSGEISIRL